MLKVWEAIPVFECIAQVDTEYIESILTEDEEFPDAEDILVFMRDYVTAHTSVNPHVGEEYEEYQIPGHWEAGAGNLDLYKDGEEYYLMQRSTYLMNETFM